MTQEIKDRLERLEEIHDESVELGVHDMQCQPGCKVFTGGERRHHKNCVFYEGSFTQMYEKQAEAIEVLRTALEAEQFCSDPDTNAFIDITKALEKAEEILK